MNLNIKFDFENIFAITDIEPDLRRFLFLSPDNHGNVIIVHVEIQPPANVFIPNVYNLVFGLLNKTGNFDDQAKISHQNPSKVYSTILFGVFTHLKKYPEKFIGIDGSNRIRAFLYYKLVQINYDFLIQFVTLIGIFFS